MKKRTAIICDMDGTLVNVSSIRHYVREALLPDGSYSKKNFDSFHKASLFCPAIWSTVDLVEEFWANSKFDILIVTARGEPYRRTTRDWLHKYSICYTQLFMRPEGDYRPDVEVKSDILDEIEKKWTVVRAIDDNPSVIALWESRGIDTIVVPGWED